MLKDHWGQPNRGDSEEQLKAWYAIAKAASWRHFADVKEQFRSASAVGDRVVFNIAGNKYRLVAYINYDFHTIYVRFVGTHVEYDEVDVKNV
jgi:mRNA interferase HigB